MPERHSLRIMQFGVRQHVRRAVVPLAILASALAPALLFVSVWVAARAAPKIHREPSSVPSRTVAIVPGARVYADGNPSPPLLDRLEAARSLYLAHRVRRILVSGDHTRASYDEVNAMHRWLVLHGVPSEDVFLDHAGVRTLDTMQRAASVFRVRDAVICTQTFHLPRALLLAEAAGIDAVGLAADGPHYGSRPVDKARELFARTRAVLDTYVLHTVARHGGEAIPIDGDARLTHDASTLAMR